MSRKKYCWACTVQEKGIKTRKSPRHTCGKEEGEPKIKCNCQCHSNSKIKHIMPCCDGGYIESFDYDLDGESKAIEATITEALYISSIEHYRKDGFDVSFMAIGESIVCTMFEKDKKPSMQMDKTAARAFHKCRIELCAIALMDEIFDCKIPTPQS